MIEIKTAITDNEIASCWEAIFLLRPMLEKENFVSQIKELQQEGYTLLYIEENNQVTAIAGYRIYTMLYCGKCFIWMIFLLWKRIEEKVMLRNF